MTWFQSISGGKVHDPILTARTGIVVRTPAVSLPLKWVIAGKLLKLLGWLLVRYFTQWPITAPLTVLGVVYLRYNWIGLVVLVLTLAAVGSAWWRWHRRSLLRWVIYPVRATFRRRTLGSRFAPVMVTSGLTVQYLGTTLLPEIVKVRCRAWLDIVTVRMIAGQMPADFAEQSQRLAHAFGVRTIRVQAGDSPDLVALLLYRGDPLARVVKPLPVTALPDFTALPLARRENGDTWTLRLFGNQVLVVGATNSGKGSVVWSFIRSLAGGVASGLVRIWAFDPKGGVELAAGELMFERFLFQKVGEMADCLDEAVELMQARSAQLRGKTRQHVPTIAEPVIVIIIDELATLTAYNTDKQLKDRIKNALALILTQGRALGFHVAAFVQDGRKEIVPFRNLFTVRIGLRLVEAEEVDLVLGDSARDRGALCDQIPGTTPGVGYVIDSGAPVPERIRFSYLTDSDIDDMTATYPRHGILTGYVVGDLEVKR